MKLPDFLIILNRKKSKITSCTTLLKDHHWQRWTPPTVNRIFWIIVERLVGLMISRRSAQREPGTPGCPSTLPPRNPLQYKGKPQARSMAVMELVLSLVIFHPTPNPFCKITNFWKSKSAWTWKIMNSAMIGKLWFVFERILAKHPMFSFLSEGRSATSPISCNLQNGLSLPEFPRTRSEWL